MAILEVQRGEAWLLEFFLGSKAPRVNKSLHKLCGVPYYT